MRPLWLILHLLGPVMWLGGAFSSMVIGAASKDPSPEAQAALARLQAQLSRLLVGPGALVTVLSGLMLTLRLVGMHAPSPWLMVMQGTGVLGGILVLFVGVPGAMKLARLSPTGPTGPLFAALRRRQALVGSVAGTLGLIALLAGAMLP